MINFYEKFDWKKIQKKFTTHGGNQIKLIWFIIKKLIKILYYKNL